MATKFEEIREQTKLLSPGEKAALVHTLVEELDDVADEDVERLWIAEAERRYEDYRTGKLEAIDGDDVMRRARKK